MFDFNNPIHSAEYDCEQCRSDAKAFRTYMIVCPDCGNKRCPQAEDHRYKCTGSNDTDQIGVLKDDRH